jgi:hypothetical protein
VVGICPGSNAMPRLNTIYKQQNNYMYIV